VHPDKKVTLCTSGKTLLSPDWKPAFPSKLHNQLVKLGVTVQYEAKIDLPESVNSAELLSEAVEISTPAGPLKTDFVLIASGGKPNTQLLPDAALDDSKRIKVNAQSLRVEHAELDKWFAIGDANNAPGSKTYMSASAQAPAVAANIVAALFQSNTIKAYKPPGAIMVVPIGTSGGASQLSIVVLGEWVTSLAKGKGLLLGM
jgi:pyruvate/2-oxoglutarate dehydrogenase complex dihydrolipoamide dehydrogenase (E3) component